MTPGGGAFLACVGAALLASVFLPDAMLGYLLIAGFLAGAAGIIIASIIGRRRGFPRPRTLHVVIVWLCVAAELLVFAFAFPLLPPDPRTLTLGVVILVGLHFLPMSVAFGAIIGWLGLACVLIGCAGFAFPQLSLSAISLTDALLKLGCGLVMLSSLFRGPSPQSA